MALPPRVSPGSCPQGVYSTRGPGGLRSIRGSRLLGEPAGTFTLLRLRDRGAVSPPQGLTCGLLLGGQQDSVSAH